MKYGSVPPHLARDVMGSDHAAPPDPGGQSDRDGRPGRVDDPVIATVVDNVDPERLARVRLAFSTLPGDDASAWAPLSALGAGADRGWFFLPEIGDEVLVMFEHGEFDRPVVIGALWNGEDAPPEQNGGKNERRCIVSRAGSRIVFDDDAGKVTLEDGGGAGTIEIDTSGRITLEASSGDVCLQAPGGEMLMAARAISIHAQAACHIESLDGIAFGADRSVQFRGAMLQVHGQKVELNPGGVSSPAAPAADCEQVPDPLGRE